MVATPNYVLQSAVPEGGTEFQLYVAVAAMIGLIIIGLIIYFESAYAKLEEPYRSVKSEAVSQARKKTPKTVFVPKDKEPNHYRAAVHTLLDGSEPEQTTVRSEARSLWSALLESLDPVVERMPAIVVRALSTAVLVTIFGLLAISTSAIATLIQRDRSLPSAAVIIGDLSEYTTSVLQVGADVLLSFPGISFLISIVLAYGIMLIDWLYFNWEYVAGGLVIFAGIILIHDYSAEEPDAKFADTGIFGYRSIVKVVAIWFAGVIPTIFVESIGFQNLAPVVGFLFAFVVSAIVIADSARNWYLSFKQTPTESYTYFVAKLSVKVLIGVGWSLVAIYAIVILLYGKFLEIIGAFYAAPPENQLLIAIILLLPVIGILQYLSEEAKDFKRALTESTHRAHIKTRVVGQGIPTIFVVSSYFVFYSFTRSIPMSVGLAIGAGLVIRGAYVAISYLRAGRSLSPDEDRDGKGVLVRAITVEHTEGETYVLWLGPDWKIAWDSKSEVVDQFVDDAERMMEGEDPKPSMQSWHARDLFQFGIWDPDETRDKVREKIRKTLANAGREKDGVLSRDEIDERTEDYPDDTVRQRLSEFVKDGIFDRTHDNVVMKRDPWTD